MNETDDLFSPRQIAQIKLANSKIRDRLRLDNYDHSLDEENLRKAIKNLSSRSESSTDSRQHKESRSKPRSQLVVALSDFLSPIGVAGLLIAFALGSLGTLALKSPDTAGSESLALRSAAEISNANALDPPAHSAIVRNLIQAGTMDEGLRALIASPQIPRFEVASKDPITLRSDIIESAVGGGLTVLAISEGGTPVIVVIGLEAKSPSHVAFRALAGIPLEVSGNVKVKVVDR